MKKIDYEKRKKNFEKKKRKQEISKLDRTKARVIINLTELINIKLFKNTTNERLRNN